MAQKCANCGSHNTQAGINNVTCTDCGKLSDYEGNVVAPGMDEATRADLLSRLGPRTTNVVGNLADLQRGGAAVLKDEGSVSSGVEAPAGTSPKSIAADAKAADKVDAALAAAADSIAAPDAKPSKK